MHYISKKYKFKDKDNKPIDRYLIIRQNENEIMPYVSSVNKYYDPHYGKIRRYEYAGKEVCSKIARFCDFLLNEKGLDPECDLGKITYEHAQEFLFYYGSHPKINSNEEPGIVSQINARNAITLFLESLKNSGINHNFDSHFLRKREGGYRGGMLYELTIYSTKSPPKYKVIRDSPKFFVEKLLEAASWYDLDLFMLMSLQIYAGLRPSEAVNVRMTSSCYGPGIIFDYAYRVELRLVKSEPIRKGFGIYLIINKWNQITARDATVFMDEKSFTSFKVYKELYGEDYVRFFGTKPLLHKKMNKTFLLYQASNAYKKNYNVQLRELPELVGAYIRGHRIDLDSGPNTILHYIGDASGGMTSNEVLREMYARGSMGHYKDLLCEIIIPGFYRLEFKEKTEIINAIEIKPMEMEVQIENLMKITSNINSAIKDNLLSNVEDMAKCLAYNWIYERECGIFDLPTDYSGLIGPSIFDN